MKLNLGTFEYGAKARWSVFLAVCAVLALLMFPAVAMAGNQITGTWSRITSIHRTGTTINRFRHATLFARNNATNTVRARAWACTANPHINTTISQATVRPTSTNRQMNANADGIFNTARWRGSAQPNSGSQSISASVTVARR